MTGSVQYTIGKSAQVLVLLALPAITAAGFEGKILAESGPREAPQKLLYTVNSDFQRVEIADADGTQTIDVVDLHTGQITLVQPDRKIVVRFSPGEQPDEMMPVRNTTGENSREKAIPPGPPMPPPGTGLGAPPPGPPFPGMPQRPVGLPPGIGPSGGIMDSGNLPGMPSLPSRPPMPPASRFQFGPAGVNLELKDTGERAKILDFDCVRYEIRQGTQIMEIWATDQLTPFHQYLSSQPAAFVPPLIEAQWSRLVEQKKLFPMKAVLRLDNGMERYRFEVLSVNPDPLSEKETAGFLPPEGYREVPARPF